MLLFITNFFKFFQFDRVCKLFCEDPATSQSDEFFGVFDLYLTSFAEAKQANDNLRRQREEEEKIAKQHQEVNILLLFYILQFFGQSSRPFCSKLIVSVFSIDLLT